MSRILAPLLLAGILFPACIATDEPAPDAADLELGSRGPEVAALNDYLARYGYFPDAKQAAVHPEWTPASLEAPADREVFDEHTDAALRALQAQGGLEITGVVDAETRALIQRPRCGNLDSAPGAGAEKWALNTGNARKWSTKSLRWRLTSAGNPSCTKAQIEAAMTTAAETWQAQTAITLTKSADAASEILVTLTHFDDDVTRALTTPIPGGDIGFDNDFTELSCAAGTPPAGKIALSELLLHELGHALGLGHSSHVDATMYPWLAGGAIDLELHAQDKVAVSVLYDEYKELGSARDVGATTGLWIVTNTAGSSGNYRVAKWNGSSFDVVAGSNAKRIAVDSIGRPWIIDAAGNVFRRSGSSTTSGTWDPIGGCLVDIAGNMGGVWGLGCSADLTGNYGVYKWDGFSFVASTGGGTRIGVGSDNIPWVVANTTTTARSVFRKNTSATTGAWIDLGAPAGLADPVDIGVSITGDACLSGFIPVGGGTSVASTHLWSEQGLLLYDDGNQAAPERFQWENLGIPSKGCALGLGGIPYLVDSSNKLKTPTK